MVEPGVQTGHPGENNASQRALDSIERGVGIERLCCITFSRCLVLSGNIAHHLIIAVHKFLDLALDAFIVTHNIERYRRIFISAYEIECNTRDHIANLVCRPGEGDAVQRDLGILPGYDLALSDGG